MTALHESDIEDAALEWLRELGWQVGYGPDISPSSSSAMPCCHGW